jgi:UDP-galactopyranose mutase
MSYDNWEVKTPILNICHTDIHATRLTHYGRLHNNGCNIVSVETPKRYPPTSELTPFYPFPSEVNAGRMNRMRPLIKALRPNLHLLGRLAQFKYIDMFQAIGAGMKLADEVDAELGHSAA